MTYTYDLANYMVKMLELEEWPEFSVFVGDEVTSNEILTMAEEIRGIIKTNIFKRSFN
jgi:hypothetical protein